MGYIHEINPENIRLWAFDDELYFSSQDEDLLLHQPEFVPILVELAALDNCPKQEYIKAILEYYIQWCFLYHKSDQLSEIAQLFPQFKSKLSTNWLIVWGINFQYIYSIYKKPQRLTAAACDKIAHDLTIGDYCVRDFQKLGVLSDGAFEYAATTASFNLHFYINPLTGVWKISTYGRLLTFE